MLRVLILVSVVDNLGDAVIAHQGQVVAVAEPGSQEQGRSGTNLLRTLGFRNRSATITRKIKTVNWPNPF